MVKHYTAPLDATFFALSDPTRRAVLARLAEGEATVTDLAAPFPMTLAALTKHLTLLERARLIVREKTGRTVQCRLRAAPLKDATDWMATYERFWPAQFDALDAYLAKQTITAKEPACPQPKPKPFDSHGASPRHGNASSGRGRTRKS
ncbi:MAG: bacterial regulatory, arsR family protein [Gammaproteobacteria bacterium]|nr:bacterial regulatory, arsR family protein [Gammaproteobacteria bacterium]